MNAFVQIEIVGGVPGLAVDACLEMQMGRRGPARLAYEKIFLVKLHILLML